MSLKRQAESDLNRENADEEENVNTEKVQSDTWKRASDDVLATRKILKVSTSFLGNSEAKIEKTSPLKNGGFASYAKVNPFASMGPPKNFSLSTGKTSCSSSEGITSTISKSGSNNNAVKSSPRVNPFGATNPAHNPFMNFAGERKPNVDYWQKFKEPAKSSSSDAVSSSDVKVTFVSPNSSATQSAKSAFSSTTSKVMIDNGNNNSNNSSRITEGSENDTKFPESEGVANLAASKCSNETESACDKNDAKPSTSVISEKKNVIDTAAMFSKPSELDNGEALEDCTLKLRAKLYRFSEVEKDSSSSTSKEWVEVGTGPLRLLIPSPNDISQGISSFPRIVMRREHQAGGPGTKVILNVLLRSHSTITKMGERAARLTCLSVPPPTPKSINPDVQLPTAAIVDEEKIVEGHDHKDVTPTAIPMTFLFKMQHSHEADQFVNEVKTLLQRILPEEKKKDES